MKTNFTTHTIFFAILILFTWMSCDQQFEFEPSNSIDTIIVNGKDTLLIQNKDTVVISNRDTLFISDSDTIYISNESFVNLSIYVLQNGEVFAPEAKVTVISGNSTLNLQTNESGLAYLENMNLGSYLVEVELEGFTEMAASLIVGLETLSQTPNVHDVSLFLPIFSPAYKSARIFGDAIIDLDLTNETAEFLPESTVLEARVDINSEEFSNLLKFSVGNADLLRVEVLDLQYEDNIFQANYDHITGEYFIDVPASTEGIPIKLTLPSVVQNQTLAINNLNGQNLHEIVQLETVFSANLSASPIPQVTPLKLMIDNPPPKGIGASFDLKLKAKSLFGTIAGADPQPGIHYTILDSGANYGIENMLITAVIDDRGNFDSSVQNSIEACFFGTSDNIGRFNGFIKINKVNGSFGFGYRGPSMVSLIGGTGATVMVNFKSTLASTNMDNTGDSGSLITDGGENYFLPPTITLEYLNDSGFKEFIQFNTGIEIDSGRIVGISELTNIVQEFTTVPEYHIEAQLPQPADLDFQIMNGVFSFSTLDPGKGFNSQNPPNLTIESINQEGSGAVFIVRLTATGEIADIVTILNGEGYPEYPSANLESIPRNFDIGAIAQIVVMSDQNYFVPIDYGTGFRAQEID